MAKLAVLDPSGLFRAALASFLQGLGFDELIEVADLDELEKRAANGARPDVVLVNLSRRNETIEEIMRDIGELFDGVRVVFLAETLDLELLAQCFAAGGSGYLLENISRDTLGKSLTLVSAGGKVFPPELAPYIPSLAAKLTAPASGPSALQGSHLSDRELEILHCLTRGQSNKAIGQTLDIAEATVKVHVKRILRKIHASNRTQAALWAAARGLSAIVNVNELTPERELVAVGVDRASHHGAIREPFVLKSAAAK